MRTVFKRTLHAFNNFPGRYLQVGAIGGATQHDAMRVRQHQRAAAID
jgi:hypothetical protein